MGSSFGASNPLRRQAHADAPAASDDGDDGGDDGDAAAVAPEDAELPPAWEEAPVSRLRALFGGGERSGGGGGRLFSQPAAGPVDEAPAAGGDGAPSSFGAFNPLRRRANADAPAASEDGDGGGDVQADAVMDLAPEDAELPPAWEEAPVSRFRTLFGGGGDGSSGGGGRLFSRPAAAGLAETAGPGVDADGGTLSSFGASNPLRRRADADAPAASDDGDDDDDGDVVEPGDEEIDPEDAELPPAWAEAPGSRVRALFGGSNGAGGGGSGGDRLFSRPAGAAASDGADAGGGGGAPSSSFGASNPLRRGAVAASPTSDSLRPAAAAVGAGAWRTPPAVGAGRGQAPAAAAAAPAGGGAGAPATARLVVAFDDDDVVSAGGTPAVSGLASRFGAFGGRGLSPAAAPGRAAATAGGGDGDGGEFTGANPLARRPM